MWNAAKLFFFVFVSCIAAGGAALADDDERSPTCKLIDRADADLISQCIIESIEIDPYHFSTYADYAGRDDFFTPCDDLINKLNEYLGFEYVDSFHISECETPLKVIENIFYQKPLWTSCSININNAEDAQLCLKNIYNYARNGSEKRRARIVEIESLDGLEGYSILPDFYKKNELPLPFLESIEEEGYACDTGRETSNYTVRGIIERVLEARKFNMERDESYRKVRIRARSVSVEMSDDLVSALESCEALLFLASLTKSYSYDEYIGKLDGLVYDADAGDASAMYRLTEILRRRNNSFFDRHNGELLEDVNIAELEQYAYFRAKNALLGDKDASYDVRILNSHINTGEAALAYLKDNPDGRWEDFISTYAGTQQRFSAVAYRNVARQAMMDARCNLATYYKSASGQQAALMTLLGGRIEQRGHTCVVSSSGQEMAIWIDRVDDMKCSEESGGRMACSAQLGFGCRTIITGENHQMADMILCTPVKALTLLSAAVVARKENSFTVEAFYIE